MRQRKVGSLPSTFRVRGASERLFATPQMYRDIDVQLELRIPKGLRHSTSLGISQIHQDRLATGIY